MGRIKPPIHLLADPVHSNSGQWESETNFNCMIDTHILDGIKRKKSSKSAPRDWLSASLERQVDPFLVGKKMEQRKTHIGSYSIQPQIHYRTIVSLPVEIWGTPKHLSLRRNGRAFGLSNKIRKSENIRCKIERERYMERNSTVWEVETNEKTEEQCSNSVPLMLKRRENEMGFPFFFFQLPASGRIRRGCDREELLYDPLELPFSLSLSLSDEEYG